MLDRVDQVGGNVGVVSAPPGEDCRGQRNDGARASHRASLTPTIESAGKPPPPVVEIVVPSAETAPSLTLAQPPYGAHASPTSMPCRNTSTGLPGAHFGEFATV